MTVACRALLYCLGLVGFFALTGAPPFTAPTMQAVMAMQVTKPSPPLASVRPDTPQYLARAIDQCLVKDPAGRWATGEALAEALRGDDSDAADVAPQVRNFQRAGEQTTATLLLLLFIVPILRVSEPKYPIIVAAAVLLMLALAHRSSPRRRGPCCATPLRTTMCGARSRSK